MTGILAALGGVLLGLGLTFVDRHVRSWWQRTSRQWASRPEVELLSAQLRDKLDGLAFTLRQVEIRLEALETRPSGEIPRSPIVPPIATLPADQPGDFSEEEIQQGVEQLREIYKAEGEPTPDEETLQRHARLLLAGEPVEVG